MAATIIAPPQITLEEYLHTVYHPDCDFVDGHLEERNMGGIRHSRLQMQLGHWFILREQEWNVRVMSELRTKVSPTRIRLPDVTVAHYDAALNEEEEVRTTPPLIAIEILSPDDRINRVIVRLKDLLHMGIPHIWLLDPVERVGFLYTHAGLKLVEEPMITIPQSPIFLDLPKLFSTLD